MESARDKRTGEIVDAEQLWIINPVDPLGYECRGCGAQATPCSYRPENKVRPYFSAKDGHNSGCDVEGEIDPPLFHIDDHRLVCCVVAEMIYPPWPAKH